MTPFSEAFFNFLKNRHDELARTVEGLSSEALDWCPGPDMNSLAVLITHVIGVERYWLGEVAFSEPAHRDREAEFQTRGLSAADLTGQLAEASTDLHRLLDSLELADLDAIRTAPHDGRQVTVAWCLAMVLAHTSTHVGHAQITRQLWEQNGPPE